LGGRLRLLVAAAVMLAAVFALYGWLKLVGPLPGDRAAGEWHDDWKPWRLPGDLFALISFFGALATPWVAAGTVLALAAVVGENLGRRWALLVVAASTVVVLNASLKHLFGPTPLWDELRDSGLNFPSGHVAYATALFGAVAWIAAQHRQRAVAATCIALIVLMGIDRVVSRAHLPSDVIAGYLVGGAWLCLVLAMVQEAATATGSSANRRSAGDPGAA
jgi:membrane-associated phospholipid phosphatase